MVDHVDVRVAGYCLTGHTTEHKLFFLYGSGFNGKSVFTGTLQGIWGDYAVAAPMDMFVEARGERHPTELALLRGARLVIASETEKGRHLNESRIKLLTGGDKIAARVMRGDFFEFQPEFKLMILGNHKPLLRSVDEAMRRRIDLIPFNVTIPPKERDIDLFVKLKEEWPAILGWAVRGCAEWRRIGLAPPKAVTDATEEYFQAEDSFSEWHDECVERSSDLAFETSANLFASWKNWAERAGEPAGSQKGLAEMLQGKGYLTKKGTGGVRGFKGIRLKHKTYNDHG